MEFGLFSLSHRELPAVEAWKEDLWEIQLAEDLGFQEAWIAEHIGGEPANSLPSADQLICKAAALTTRMRFGPGVRPLPHYHPVHVATQAAVSDQLTEGRYMAGFGGARGAARPGGGRFDMLH
ncbi:MAG: LLM class flavin-dependent oxidoreductase, partial [Chloroflexi bacterium]|nr:LLM class flavin-dependent oxidoreductase [Chloroflexota bacterium]